MLDLPADATRAQLLDALKDSIVGKGASWADSVKRVRSDPTTVRPPVELWVVRIQWTPKRQAMMICYATPGS